ncbi:hypothetical protein PQO03_21810 [Lentisphaera profundi]|uniref:Uncharacterized protein n=1 Tax=Lentisphaera profundi TaxID=1658616 RepID=A0ABY7VW42_9BACT|nr:hypothetical protein [Lentisphaera profundi]WDE98450.1 hypothetical protein PQO03_21810 [Lentisphaera profundi]
MTRGIVPNRLCGNTLRWPKSGAPWCAKHRALYSGQVYIFFPAHDGKWPGTAKHLLGTGSKIDVVFLPACVAIPSGGRGALGALLKNLAERLKFLSYASHHDLYSG